MAKKKTRENLPEFIQDVRNFHQRQVFNKSSSFLSYKLSTVYLPGQNENTKTRADMYAHEYDGHPKYQNITNRTDVFYMNKTYVELVKNE